MKLTPGGEPVDFLVHVRIRVALRRASASYLLLVSSYDVGS